MPTPRPLREGYPIAKDTKKEIKDTIRPLVDYSIKGNQKFITEFARINWNSLSAKNVFDVILLFLSYGLKTNREIFEKYIKQEYMKGSVSLFKFMRDYDGIRLKEALNTGSFREIFKFVFGKPETDIDWEKELNELRMRVTKINSKDIIPEQKADLDAFIDTIVSGKSVEAIYVPEEQD